MKMLLAAIALTIASPALAQTAAADPHAGHSGHAGHTGHAMPAAPASGQTPAADPHAGHDMSGDCCKKAADGKMACCDKAKADGKKMECCDKAASKDAHAGHDMSSH